jgi:Cu2+-exporting ATPase
VSAASAKPGADAAASCRHCGLPVPPERRERGDAFCCGGCSRVHELLSAGGLGRYYELRGERGIPPAELRESGMAWLDPLLAAAGGADGAEPRTLTLGLQGVHCAACVWLLRELFTRRDGAVALRINPASGRADLTVVPGRFDVRSYLVDVERFGYRFGPPMAVRVPHSRSLLLRLGVCAAAAGNVMLFSFSLYAGLGRGDGALYALFGWLSLALTAVAVAVGGWVFVRSAAAGLRRGVAHLDLPIALGIVLAFGGSVYAHLAHGAERAFYDTVAVFVTLMLLGRFLQERVLERNRASVLTAEGIEGLMVRRVDGRALESVRADRIETGDDLLVVAGDLVPVAAVALGDGGSVTLDWITGEPDVRAVAAGDDVPAGAFNAGRTGLRVCAAEPFAASRLHDLLGRTAPSADVPLGPAGAWWHRLGTIYVAGVLTAALAGFLVWLPRGPEVALAVTVSVLVVTCPCAIGLAVPLAQELVHVALRRAGVFVRRQSFLDRALRVRTVLFDKTGTLTRDRLALLPASRAALDGLSAEAREVTAAMAARSNHPASRALAEALGKGAPAVAAAMGTLEEIPGRGLQWTHAGTAWRLGRPEFAAPATAAATPGAPGETWLARGVEVLARLELAEEVRTDVKADLERLRASGLEVRVLSGDHPDRVRALARRVGLDEERAEGGLGPEAKAARVRELDRHDTLMVGDGINDAPSFAAAYCTATPAVDRPHLPARADLYYLGDGVAAVAHALAAARRLRRVVWGNLAFALAYNAVALALAFAGVVTPVLAAVLMPASSLTVVGVTIARLAGGRRPWTS